VLICSLLLAGLFLFSSRARIEAERKKQQEQDDLQRFTREFVAEGGDVRDAEKEFRRTRSARAATRAQSKAQAARREMYAGRMREV
jgi:ABC-type bacteriocin/lantibiotic exporter with double-glycine peptidase domain